MDGLASAAKRARSFGELLRQHRLAAGIAQETLAERARLSVETISALERGARQKPYLETIALLAEALGLSPDGRAELERAASRRSVPQPTNNLPAQISSFVGRELDVAKVSEILVAYRLLTLVGPGGVGKTRLALRVAAALVGARRDGIWFVDFAALSDVSRIASAIAVAVGISQSSDLDQVLRFLQTKTVLLIFDNCEYLIEGVALAVNTILRACPTVAILATSREPLSIEGERVYRVPPLELNDAIKLFAERAEGADSRFQLTDSIRRTVEEICRHLDGIALAIEIAAARTAVVSTQIIATELDEYLRLTVGASRGRAARQRTMAALFDWSYQLLNEREQHMFRRLAVFVGGFSEELAVDVCASPAIGKMLGADTLASLVRKSLVQGEAYTEPPRYRLLEPVRQYARGKLRKCSEDRAAARAHALALLALAERFDSPQKLMSDRVRATFVDPERENFRMAIEWALGKNGDATIAQQLVGSRTAAWYGLMSGEAQGWIESALASCDETTSRHIRANLELAAARFATEFVPDPQAALDRAEQALCAQPPDDPSGVAGAQYLVGVALANAGRIGDSDAAFRKALATAHSAGLQYIVAAATVSLGTTRFLLGDRDEARDLLSKALQLYQSAGCERLAATAAPLLAEVELAAGELETASRLSRDVADFFRRGHDRLPPTTAAQLAEIEFWVGHTETALELSREATDLFGAQHDWGLQALALVNRAAYLVALRRYDEARSEAREGLLLAKKIGMRRGLPWALQHLAAVAGFRTPTDRDRLDILRSAQLLGFVDEEYARTAGVRQPTEQQEKEKLLVLLRERLGEQELAKLAAEGATWTVDRAIAEALEI